MQKNPEYFEGNERWVIANVDSITEDATMKKYYVFHYRPTSISSYMLHDFEEDNRFIICTNMHVGEPGIVELAQKIVFSAKLNKKASR